MTKDYKNKRIILASASPRRKDILEGMGVTFTVLTANTDESSDISDPIELTTELARRKGEAVYSLLCQRGESDGAIVIAADTVVACDGRILGKPKDEREAREMLTLLSGRTHIVATGIAVISDDVTYTDCSVTEVEVDTIPEVEMTKYINSKDPFDKAGGYGIQGNFSKWVRGIHGCYFGVVGLPTNKLSSLFFKAVGVYPDEI